MKNLHSPLSISWEENSHGELACIKMLEIMKRRWSISKTLRMLPSLSSHRCGHQFEKLLKVYKRYVRNSDLERMTQLVSSGRKMSHLFGRNESIQIPFKFSLSKSKHFMFLITTYVWRSRFSSIWTQWTFKASKFPLSFPYPKANISCFW